VRPVPDHPTLNTKILSRDGKEQLVLEGCELLVKRGTDRGATLTLSMGPQRIGTGADCDLVLTDSTVSGHHAEVSATSRGYVLRDLGSKNGIQLGGWYVESVLLAPRMGLLLGDTTLFVRLTGESQTFPLSEVGEVAGLVAQSVAMRAVLKQIQIYANSDMPVLIEGETGTGKEVAARALHQLGSRQAGPFVVVDLPGIPSSLISAELFGHEKGAFTGAELAREGLFTQADGGTLFLDEIGELPLELQPVLLRAVERKESRPVGGSRVVPHDARVICATNRNLAEEVKAGRFREDLYFRLAVGHVRIPPLRVRREDIPPLAYRFAREAGCTLSPELTQVLLGYEWPGNVRELRNTISRVAAMPDATLRQLREDSANRPAILPLSEARRAAIEEFEARYLKEVFAASGGVVTEAARIAGVSRSFLSRLAGRHRLRPSDH